MTNTAKRVQMDMPERSLARLQELKLKTEASSYAEVIKNSLRLYEALIAEAEQGSTFLVKTKEGTLKEFLVF